jgi:hypothetical protein
MEKTKQEVFTGSWALPIVRYGATRYFADLRLSQFRDIINPHNCVDFNSEQGKRICRHSGVILCPECGTGAIVSPALDIEKLRCVKCFNLIVPLFDI